MIEHIESIAKKIQRHRELEISIGAINNAIARAFVKCDEEEQQFWLVNRESAIGGKKVLDIKGNLVETLPEPRSTYEDDGQTVFKNTKLGEALIRYHEGNHKISVPKGHIDIEIFNRATFNPSKIEGEYVNDLVIRIAGDSKIYSFRTLVEIIKLQQQIDEEKEQLKKATDDEARILVDRITKNEQRKIIYLAKAQSFIRKYAQLRYQPILDPVQESIKRSKIFDGVLIINGGPGTGKTTSLIQRIKFLISSSIEEYKQLTQPQKDVLYSQKTSWIFYSPNELLALFLRNSMQLEGLTADSERVKVWAVHKNELVKAYRLVSETKRPFMIYNRAQVVNLIQNDGQNINTVIEGLNNHYSKYQNEKLLRIIGVDISVFKWNALGQSIQNYIKENKNVQNREDLIRLYLNLSENFGSRVKSISEEYTTLITLVASRIQVEILKDKEKSKLILEKLKQWKVESQENDNDEVDEIEIEQEDFDEADEYTAFEFERELFNVLKSICRKQALSKYDKNTRFNKRDKELLDIIPEVLNQNEYEELGQKAFFKKHFERVTKGIGSNILREIPMIYKKYRREQFENHSSSWNLQILEELVKKDRNSRIHLDEQSLLLYFINTLVLVIAKSFVNQFKELSHPYINGFKNHCKPVIGIDEATDFSIIDLITINSFGHPEISSVTLSGDLMQRMTTVGITSWNDFVKIVPNCESKNLEISYRQSPTLLSLAKKLYEKSTGESANYNSYISKDESEPKPLMFLSQNEDEKLNWIANRIHEIYRAYGDSIPSIAIFLPEENQLEEVANKLGSLDTLADVGIQVKACRNGEVLGDKNTVRVFSIKVIKGLEFESVFFHNCDELQSKYLEKDLFIKYLYVGLSRATFYLGLTLSNKLSADISFIADSFEKSNKTWALQ